MQMEDDSQEGCLPFDDLPTAIQFDILSFLDAKDASICMQSNTRNYVLLQEMRRCKHAWL
jgi:hypothetical protein